LLDAGVRVTVNSDDPAYFGGYIGDNFVAVRDALGLSSLDLMRLAQNSVESAFAPLDRKVALLHEIDEWARQAEVPLT
jgi:adenosine deaminase